MEKWCDNQSVGVVLKNQQGELALLKRGRYPVGMAPAAGHIDAHGTPEQAAIDELHEELGVDLAINGLTKTVIEHRLVKNLCRRPGGEYHIWNIYEATIDGAELKPDPHETKGAGWYALGAVQALANRTKLYMNRDINEREWRNNPGLEVVWYDFLSELKYIE